MWLMSQEISKSSSILLDEKLGLVHSERVFFWPIKAPKAFLEQPESYLSWETLHTKGQPLMGRKGAEQSNIFLWLSQAKLTFHRPKNLGSGANVSNPKSSRQVKKRCWLLETSWGRIKDVFSLWLNDFKLMCTSLYKAPRAYLKSVWQSAELVKPMETTEKTILPARQSSLPEGCRDSWFYSASHQTGSLQDFARHEIVPGDSSMHRGFCSAYWRQKQNENLQEAWAKPSFTFKEEWASFNSWC